MKTFTCGEVVPGCDATFVAERFEDLLRQIADHAAKVHGVASLPPEVAEELRAYWQGADADT